MAAWRDEKKWRKLRDGRECPICEGGQPLGVLAQSATTWVTTGEHVTCRGYACVVSKRHVVEPFELSADEMAQFFADAAAVARAINDLFRPLKLNYEIHGNTIPHLHMHVFPRYLGDPFEGGPIRASERHASHSTEDIERMSAALGSELRR